MQLLRDNLTSGLLISRLLASYERPRQNIKFSDIRNGPRMMLRMRSRKHQNKNQAMGRSDEVQFIGYALYFYLVTFTDAIWMKCILGIEMYHQIIKLLVSRPSISLFLDDKASADVFLSSLVVLASAFPLQPYCFGMDSPIGPTGGGSGSEQSVDNSNHNYQIALKKLDH
uniref:Uncharacterized protein n=1 Tax=Salix viminalis TaxID=40686 RepID=A0A6N2KVC0_SALVM